MNLKGILLAFLCLAGCASAPDRPSGFVTYPPAKLSSLGVTLSAYVILSTDPGEKQSLTLDPVSNSFKGEVKAPTGVPFDLTVVYTADDPVSGETVHIAHYIRRNLIATGSTMRVAYAGDEANWETLFYLDPDSPNELNLDGDAYNNFIEIGYRSDPSDAASLP